MITKNDLVLILSDLQDKGIDTAQQIRKVLVSKEVPIDVIKFINDNREFDVSKFYTHIRKSGNQKKSKLYINIMREIDDVNDVLTTLASMNLQILLYSKNVQDKNMFLKQSRAEEIAKVLTLYYRDFDLTNCVKLLRLIKADIIAFETISGRRENTL